MAGSADRRSEYAPSLRVGAIVTGIGAAAIGGAWYDSQAVQLPMREAVRAEVDQQIPQLEPDIVEAANKHWLQFLYESSKASKDGNFNELERIAKESKFRSARATLDKNKEKESDRSKLHEQLTQSSGVRNRMWAELAMLIVGGLTFFRGFAEIGTYIEDKVSKKKPLENKQALT